MVICLFVYSILLYCREMIYSVCSVTPPPIDHPLISLSIVIVIRKFVNDISSLFIFKL